MEKICEISIIILTCQKLGWFGPMQQKMKLLLPYDDSKLKVENSRVCYNPESFHVLHSVLTLSSLSFQKYVCWCHCSKSTLKKYHLKYTLPVAMVVNPLVLYRENYPCNILQVWRCTSTKCKKLSLLYCTDDI